MTTLETGVALSKSVLWTLEKQFYAQQGVNAWSQKIVPFLITSNGWIAAAYAKVIVGLIQDLMCPEMLDEGTVVPRLHKDEPIYIVEYGAGCGRLAFYLLRAFEELSSTYRFLKRMKIVYVMTDFTMANVQFWRDHDMLQPYFQDGRLDCALADATEPFNDLELLVSGVRLTEGSVVNPMICVCNYFMCITPADAFLVDRAGTLTEGLVTSRSEREDEDLTDETIISRIRKTFTQTPVDPATRYPAPDHPALNLVLQEYHELLRDKGYPTSFLMPVGATRCVEGLVRLCRGHDCVLTLCGDKGYTQLAELEGRVGYPMSVEGSFSFMANMDGIGRYFSARGGSVMHNPVKVEAQGDTCLSVGLYLTTGQLASLPHCSTAFSEELARFGPADFYQLMHVMCVHEPGHPPPPVVPCVDMHPENRYLDPTADMSELTPSNEPAPTISLDEPDVQLRWQNCIRDAATCGFSLQQLLAMLRMSRYDPYVFWQTKARILVLTSIAYEEEKNEMGQALEAVFQNYFHIGEDEDIPFELGRVAYQLQLDNYKPALRYYESSIRIFGDHYITLYNISLCYNEQGRKERALRYAERSVELNSEYEPAQVTVQELKEQIAALVAGGAPPVDGDGDGGGGGDDDGAAGDGGAAAPSPHPSRVADAAKRMSQLSVSPGAAAAATAVASPERSHE